MCASTREDHHRHRVRRKLRRASSTRASVRETFRASRRGCRSLALVLRRPETFGRWRAVMFAHRNENFGERLDETVAANLAVNAFSLHARFSVSIRAPHLETHLPAPAIFGRKRDTKIWCEPIGKIFGSPEQRFDAF